MQQETIDTGFSLRKSAIVKMDKLRNTYSRSSWLNNLLHEVLMDDYHETR